MSRVNSAFVHEPKEQPGRVIQVNNKMSFDKGQLALFLNGVRETTSFRHGHFHSDMTEKVSSTALAFNNKLSCTV